MKRGKEGREEGRKVHENRKFTWKCGHTSPASEFFPPSLDSEKHAVPSSLGLPRQTAFPGVPRLVFNALIRLPFKRVATGIELLYWQKTGRRNKGGGGGKSTLMYSH